MILLKSFRGDWEFYRYLLFRNELSESKIRPEDVKFVIPLLDLEQQTLGSYVAQRPLRVWLYTTTGAILATSAKNWPLEAVAVWVALAILVLFIHYNIPIFITTRRRRYDRAIG
jgi:hypothetical protein